MTATVDELTEATAAAEPEDAATVPTEEPTVQPAPAGDDAPPDGPDAPVATAADEEPDDRPGDAEDDATANPDAAVATGLTERQKNALARFGLDEQSAAGLGEKAVELAERLAKVQADTGRRYAAIGRTERQMLEGDDGDPSDAFAYDPRQSSLQPAEGEYLQHVGRELSGLRRRVTELTDELAGERRSRLAEADERFFASLDAEAYPRLAGAGEASARKGVLDEADAMIAGHARVHGRTMPRAEALRRAVDLLHPEARTAAAVELLRRGIEQRRGQALARPTQLHAPGRNQTPEQHAAAALSRRARELGADALYGQ